MKAPWTKHSQTRYKELAKNKDAPAYLRVAWLAMGRHLANGHAEFKRGELASILTKNGKPYRGVDNAIAMAVRYGLLDLDSTSRCLVVPDGLIEGPIGDSDLDCMTHKRLKAPRMADCCPERKHHANGKCRPCYQRAWRDAKTLGSETFKAS